MDNSVKGIKLTATHYCKVMGVPVTVFNTDDDSNAAVSGRWFVWWMCRANGATLVDLAAATSGGGHAPIFYACQRVDHWRDICPTVKEYTDLILAGIPVPHVSPVYLMNMARGMNGERFKPGDAAYFLSTNLKPRHSIVRRVNHRKNKYILALESGESILETEAMASAAEMRATLRAAIAGFTENDPSVPSLLVKDEEMEKSILQVALEELGARVSAAGQASAVACMPSSVVLIAAATEEK